MRRILRRGSALTAAVGAGVTAAVVLPPVVGVPAAYGGAAVSLLARARTAAGRVRLRLTLSAVSVAAGGCHYVLLECLARAWGPSAGVLRTAAGPVAAVEFAACLGVAFAALVMTAAENGAPLIWLRRLLDGWLVAGPLLTVGRVLLLHHVDQVGDTPASLLGLARVVADIVALGLLAAVCFCRRQAERTATMVAVLALTALTAGDTLRVLLPAPGGWHGFPLAAACCMSGLCLVALSPWLPGGLSEAGFDRRMMPVVGVVAAFAPVAVSALALAGHAAAGGTPDGVLMGLAGSVLLALSVRQGVLQADQLRLTQESAAREDHYRTLVDGTSDVITIVSLDGRVLYVSPASLLLFGYPPEDLVGAHLTVYCHPEDLETLLQAFRTLRQEAQAQTLGASRRVCCRVRASDGGWRHVESAISHHPQGMIFISRDVSDRVAQQAHLERLAFHDGLTGLPNRALFADRVAHALRKRTVSTAPPVVLFLDLDGFKAVNDSAGHAAGDALLATVARRLQSSVRAGDTVARLGGDEFAALLEWDAERDPSSAREVAQRILAALTLPYQIGSTHAMVSASIGMAVAVPGITPDELLHCADLAMYEAKAAGKGRIHAHPHLTPEYEGVLSDTGRAPEP